MQYKLLAVLLVLFSLVSFCSFKPVKVFGKITDEAGTPVYGAIVSEKGHATKTTTDQLGMFSISVSAANSTLVIHAKGFLGSEMAVRAGKSMNLTLVKAPEKLEEKAASPKLMGEPLADLEVMPQGVAQSRSNLSKIKRGYIGSVQSTPNVGYPGQQNDHAPAPGNFNTEDYDGIVENRFLNVAENALSTFSIDVDAASYSNLRRYLQGGQLPPAGAVRIEEMINYFHYDYPQPLGTDPFSINTEIAACSWNPAHRLVLIGLQGRKIPVVNLPASNMVFLIDVSGSMEDENKLPLVKASMKLLVEQLREQDKVSIVVYAGSAGLVLPPTSGSHKQAIRDAIDRLEAGGSTAGGEGIQLAYEVARKNFLPAGNNRVILCTDGDFNVGMSSDAGLEQMIEQERKGGVFLTVLGYGMGNYKDNKMQKLADKGNGNHAYIDGMNEAKKVLVSEFGGTLFTIAKDVKLQVEFNPARVQAYRLIGYENRLLNKEDFNNDSKDAGELGSGHTVTALYEVIPVGVKNEFSESVDTLRYRETGTANPGAFKNPDEIMNIKFRYKKPDGNASMLMEHPVKDQQADISHTSDNFRFASSVAEFGMLLRHSEFRQGSSYEDVRRLATHALGRDEEGYRKEFLLLIDRARLLSPGKVEYIWDKKAVDK